MIASGLSAKSLVGYLQEETANDFPPPGMIEPTHESWGSATANGDGSMAVSLNEGDGALVRRVLDPDTATTLESTSIEGNEGEFELPPVQPSTIEMIYRRGNDGNLEYLTDMPLPTDIKLRLRGTIGGVADEYYDRSFEDRWIEVTFHPGSSGVSSSSFRIPYSLYVHASETNPTGPVPTAVSPSDSGFERYDHGPLVETVTPSLDALDEAERDYWRVASIADVIQSIPHLTDWVSRGELHYVRTPAEMFAELTADCKDAAVLLYNLFELSGYDPVFILLIGDVASQALQEDEKDASTKERKNDEEKKPSPQVKRAPEDLSLYPNHIAVGVPVEQLEPIPDEAGEIATFEKDGMAYAYVESTRRALPGVYQDPNGRTTSVVYSDRRDMLRQIITV